MIEGTSGRGRCGDLCAGVTRVRVRVRALKPRFIVTLKSEAQLFNGREGNGAEAIFVQVDCSGTGSFIPSCIRL